MKNYKPEKIIWSGGVVILLVVMFAAVLNFGEWEFERETVQRGVPGNPWENQINQTRGMLVNQNINPAGFVNIAMQDPSRPGGVTGNFQKQQDRVNKKLLKTIQLSEAHWQGMELMELTPELKMKFQYPMELTGLLVDEVTLNALASGVKGGDVLQAVEKNTVKNLRQFQELTRKLRHQSKAKLTVWRQGRIKKFKLRSGDMLGMAQMESAPMILPGAMRPHPYRGPCTDCHLIGDTVTLKPDPDGVILPPPQIKQGARMPHRDRGPCKACHVIVQ